MARKFLIPVDMGQLEILQLRIQNLSSAPGTPVSGQVYYNTTNNTLWYRNDTTWVSVDPSSLLSSTNTWTAAQTFNAAITGNNTINLTGTGSSSVAGNFSAVLFAPTGLTGATTTTRYVGGTTSGAPVTGTFSAGDYIVTTGGDVWICTTGGSPGTWSRVGTWLLSSANTWSAAQTFNAAITGNNTINLTGTGASSVGGNFSATTLSATGLTGASSTSRYAGATASGAPVTGTFAVGDWVIAQDGALFVCTSAGSPGTWTEVGATFTVYNQFVKANNGSAVTQRSTLNFINGTYTTATAVDNASQTDVKFDVTTGSVTAQTSYGLSSSNGTGTNLALANHTHGTPSLSANVASAQAPGDTATNGTGTAPAKDDHKHSLPGWGIVGSMAAANSFGGSNSAGVGTTFARIDHNHALPAHDASAHSGISISNLSAPSGNVSWGNNKITNLGTPTADTDAANKGYVDGVATGLDVKASVTVASTANVTVTYSSTGGTSGRGQITAVTNSIDGVTLVAGDRVLLKNQSTGAQNGIWTVTTAGTGSNGTWDRATDFDSDAEVTAGAFTFVEKGTANADSGWVLTTDNPIVIGGASGTALTWVQFSGAGQITAGAGLTKTANTLDVGAGTGITVNANDVAVNRTGTNNAHVPLLYSTGTHASSTSIAISHNLGNQWVHAQVFEISSGNQVEVDVTLTSSNVTTFTFAVAPTANTYRFVIYG